MLGAVERTPKTRDASGVSFLAVTCGSVTPLLRGCIFVQGARSFGRLPHKRAPSTCACISHIGRYLIGVYLTHGRVSYRCASHRRVYLAGIYLIDVSHQGCLCVYLIWVCTSWISVHLTGMCRIYRRAPLTQACTSHTYACTSYKRASTYGRAYISAFIGVYLSFHRRIPYRRAPFI